MPSVSASISSLVIGGYGGYSMKTPIKWPCFPVPTFAERWIRGWYGGYTHPPLIVLIMLSRSNCRTPRRYVPPVLAPTAAGPPPTLQGAGPQGPDATRTWQARR